MPTDILITLLVLLGIFLGLPILALWINDRLRDARWRKTNPAEKLEADRLAREARLLRPDWLCLERHLQRPVPHALRELYADTALISARGIPVREVVISSFEPIEERALQDARDAGIDPIMPIAWTEWDDPVHLLPGARETDAVYITRIDGGDIEKVTESVEEFLAVVRSGERRAV